MSACCVESFIALIVAIVASTLLGYHMICAAWVIGRVEVLTPRLIRCRFNRIGKNFPGFRGCAHVHLLKI